MNENNSNHGNRQSTENSQANFDARVTDGSVYTVNNGACSSVNGMYTVNNGVYTSIGGAHTADSGAYTIGSEAYNPDSGAYATDGGAYNLKIDSSAARILSGFALAAAVLYSLCFTGRNIYPKLSLFVFTCVSIILLYAALKKTALLKNKKAFMWAVPLIVISSFNAIFDLRFFSYVNVVIVHLMFAALVFSAIKDARNDLSDLFGWHNLLKTIFPNIKIPFRIFRHSFEGKRQKTSGILVRIALGTLLAAPVLAVITAALMGADAVFAVIMKKVFNGLFAVDIINIIGHIIAIMAAMVYFTAYVYNAEVFTSSKACLPQKNPDNIIGFTFLFLINILFLFFCVIQTAFLFAGGFMKLPEGIVYSAYAREGFFQLLFVTVINFGVIIIFLKIFPSCVNSKMLKTMLVMLCFFTGILIISSFYRMSLYTAAYGYTDIRMNVIVFLSMETVLIYVSFRYLFKPNINFLGRYIYIALVFYMAANIMSSAYVVGRLNVNRLYAGYDIDIGPLCQSAETVGLLAEIYNTPEFAAQTNDNEKELVYAILTDSGNRNARMIFTDSDNRNIYVTLTDYGDNGIGPWQNISLIAALSERRLKTQNDG